MNEAAAAARAGLEPPPGETGTELTGTDAIAALDDALQLISETPRVRVPLKDVAIQKIGAKVVFTVKYRGAASNEFTVRLTRAWAEVVYGRLGQVLGK